MDIVDQVEMQVVAILVILKLIKDQKLEEMILEFN